MALRLRRGTDAERQQPGFIPESGELIYTTDTKLVYVGDGSTEGGLPISSGAFATTVESDLSPSLGGNLDLNNKNIVGTGEIGEVGTPITAIRSSLLATDTLSSETQPEVTLGSNLNLGGMDIVGIGNINIDGTVVATGTVIPGGGAGSDLNVGTLTATTVKTDVLSSNSSAVSLGNNLDLGANNIVGVGNINIDGTITATGNISLGDDASDVVDIPGSIGSNIIPQIDNFFNLGTDTLAWKSGHFSTVNADSVIADSVSASTITNSANEVIIDTETKTLDINSIFVDYISGKDSSLLYNGASDTVAATSFVGSLSGSLFASDSTPIFDGITGEFSGPFRVNAGDAGGSLILDSISANESFIELNVSNGTNDVPTATAPGDGLSGMLAMGHTGTDYSRASGIAFFADPDGVAGPYDISGKIMFVNKNLDGSDDVTAYFSASGEFAAPIIKPGGYANETDRDLFIASPRAGQIIYLENTAEFQGHNGIRWETLSNADKQTISDIASSGHSVSLSDFANLITLRAGGPISIPDASDTAIPVGFYTEIVNLSSTAATIDATIPAQVISAQGTTPSLASEGLLAKITKISETEWLVTGDLS